MNVNGKDDIPYIMEKNVPNHQPNNMCILYIIYIYIYVVIFVSPCDNVKHEISPTQAKKTNVSDSIHHTDSVQTLVRSSNYDYPLVICIT